jgi:hypothetical protein
MKHKLKKQVNVKEKRKGTRGLEKGKEDKWIEALTALLTNCYIIIQIKTISTFCKKFALYHLNLLASLSHSNSSKTSPILTGPLTFLINSLVSFEDNNLTLT